MAVPQIPAYLDAVLCDTPLTGGIEPKLGDQHLRILTVLGFPNVTTPGLLDALNDLGFAYRWVTRWIPLDKTEATRQLTKLRRHWFAKRKSVGRHAARGDVQPRDGAGRSRRRQQGGRCRHGAAGARLR